MKHTLLTLLLSLVALGASAKVTITEKDFVDTVHIKYINGKILVPVTIGGRTYDFWYDSGANICQIPDSLADQLFKKDLSSRKVGDYNQQTSGKSRIGVLNETQIGHFHVNGLQSTSGNVKNFLFGAHQLYLAGISVKIDLMKGVMIFTNRKNFFKDEEIHLIPEKFLSVLTEFKFTMSHAGDGHATFDTGNTMFFSIDRKFYEEAANGPAGKEFLDQLVWADTVAYAGYSGVPVKQEQAYLKVEELKMGDLTFHNVPVTTTDNYKGFGCRMLECGTIIVDGRKMSSFYQPYAGGTTVDLTAQVPQVKFDFDGKRVFVRRIDARGSIFAAGVRIGDKLESIEGREITSVDELARVLQQLDDTKPWTVRFRLADGREIDVTVKDQQHGYFFMMC